MNTVKNTLLGMTLIIALHWLPGTADAVPLDEQDIAILSCAQLDAEISAMIPNTYSTTPSLYDNPKSILAANISLFVYSPAVHYLVYTESEKVGEQVKIRRYQDRVAELRLAKARKRCYE